MAELSVLIHCNAGPGYGLGHLMRSLALAEEACVRGWQVKIVGAISDDAIAHAVRIAPEVMIAGLPAERLEAGLESEYLGRPDVVHFDTYRNVPIMPDSGIFVSNMQDGRFGVRPADLAIDANLGAEHSFERPVLSRHHLAGIDAVLIRRQVRRLRGAPTADRIRPAVLVVLGGTDERRLTQAVVQALEGLDASLDLTVVCPSDQQASVAALVGASRHAARIETFIEDLPTVAQAQDLIITAAGTSVWDFACLGIPMALLCVEENQERGYRAAVDAGLGVPLGEPPHSDLAERIRSLGANLADRAILRDRGAGLRSVVDGRGAWRIVSAWQEQLSVSRAPHEASSSGLTARLATLNDARLLFDWRNDGSTRAHSRSQEEFSWSRHVSWLEACIADPDRRLLIIETREEPVATVRWDRRSTIDWEVSITVAPEHRGRGLARGVLAVGEAALDVVEPVRLTAGVHVGNVVSRSLFVSAGYLPQLPPDEKGFEMRAKWRLRSEG